MADQLRAAQDTPIWNAIEANNFKQALKLVDKRLSKKHSDYLEVGDTEDTRARALSGCFSQTTNPHDFGYIFMMADPRLTGFEDLYPVSFAPSV